MYSINSLIRRYVMKKLLITDSDFPENLRVIKNPPKQLYLKGDISLLKTPIVSIVGSRSCSDNGIRLANKFATELSLQNITIASGLAKGIDSASHQATLDVGGKTIAVLGSGLDNVFPKENQKLYEEIIQKGGLVLSEYPPETEAKSNYFLQRNRIVSGIALGILVVEAAYRSGTSVTAKFAKAQNRKVFVLPHEIDDMYGVGTNRLLKNGATLVTSTEEIINSFDFLNYKPSKNLIVNSNASIFKKKTLKNPQHKEIYDLIDSRVISLDEIYSKSNKSISQINYDLFMLEIEGYIKREAGGYKCV